MSAQRYMCPKCGTVRKASAWTGQMRCHGHVPPVQMEEYDEVAAEGRSIVENDAIQAEWRNEHQTRTRWNSEGFRAECSCGWRGQKRESAANALVDGHSHAKASQHGPFPRIAVDPDNPAHETDLDEVDNG